MKKRLSLILAALLVCLPTLAACGGDEGGQGGAVTTTDAGSSASAETTVAETSLLDTLPKENYDDYKFHILGTSRDWAVCNMTAEEMTGETINDAIYKRQLAIEERLQIQLVEDLGGNVSARLGNAVMSQSHEYDLYNIATGEALSAYQKSYVVDQTQIDTMNLDNPWWAQSFNDTVNIGDKRYITFGQSNLVYYNGFYVLGFNKQMITDLGLENPHDLVKAGTWTWDKMYEMMQSAATDLNGDGTYALGEDTVGFTGHVNHMRNLMLSSGETITQTDADGNPTYTGLSERYINSFEKFMNNFIDNPIAAVTGCSPSRYTGYTASAGVKNYLDVFNRGYSLFTSTGTYELIALRESSMEYGLVIMPKYDENQQNYVAPVYSAVDGMCIPSTTTDLDRAGVIMETLGALSYNNVVDALISNVLHYKCANSETDIEMINLVFENGAVDVALANNFGSCANVINSLHTYYNHSVVSAFATMTKKMEADIAAAIEDPQA